VGDSRNQTLPRIRAVTSIVDESVWQPRLNAVMLTAFAAVTLLLALAGVYGLVARMVDDRTAEIGIRVAVGARPVDVVLMVVRQGFGPVCIGMVGGTALTLASRRFVGAQLYGVSQTDPATFAAGTAMILAAAFLAMMRPALRASSVDPVIALRHD
jgi:putative ABC transport system permease protein